MLKKHVPERPHESIRITHTNSETKYFSFELFFFRSQKNLVSNFHQLFFGRHFFRLMNYIDGTPLSWCQPRSFWSDGWQVTNGVLLKQQISVSRQPGRLRVPPRRLKPWAQESVCVSGAEHPGGAWGELPHAAPLGSILSLPGWRLTEICRYKKTRL